MENDILRAAALALLLVNSIVDIKSRKINLLLTLLAGAAGGAARLIWLGDGIRGLLRSLLPGMLLVLLSAVSQGGIGMGDGIVLAALGLMRTWEEVWEMMILGFFLAGAYAAVLFLRRRKGEERFAFVPFLLLADILMILTGG